MRASSSPRRTSRSGSRTGCPGRSTRTGPSRCRPGSSTDIVTSLPATCAIDLELLGDDRIHLTCGRFETHIKGMPPTSSRRSRPRASGRRPASPRRCSGRRSARWRSRPPRRRRARSSPASSPSFEGDRLTLAAADNYRIAITTIPVLTPVEETSIVVPARSYRGAGADPRRRRRPGGRRPLAEPQPGPVPHSRARTSSAASSTASSRTTSRSCPRSTRRAPSSTGRSSSGRCSPRRCSPASRRRSSSSTSAARATAGISVTAVSDLGDHQSEVDATVEGDGTTIAFNAGYLTDVLQNVDAEPSSRSS